MASMNKHTDALDKPYKALREAGIDLCCADMKRLVKDQIERFGYFSRCGERLFFATLGEAVSRCLESQSVVWVNREDRIGGQAPDRAQDARTVVPRGPRRPTR